MCSLCFFGNSCCVAKQKMSVYLRGEYGDTHAQGLFVFCLATHFVTKKTKNVGEYGDTHAQGLDGGATEACRGRVCFFFLHLILA